MTDWGTVRSLLPRTFFLTCLKSRNQIESQVCGLIPKFVEDNFFLPSLMIWRSRMVLGSPGPLLTPPPASSPPKTPFRSYSDTTPPRYGNPTPPSPGGRGNAAAAGGAGAWEARTGPRQTQTCSDTPVTAWLCRVRELTTLQPTKWQPSTVGAVERGGRVTMARQTTTRAVPGCSLPSTYARWRCTEAAHNAHFYKWLTLL